MLMTSCFVCATLNLGRKKSTGTEPQKMAAALALSKTNVKKSRFVRWKQLSNQSKIWSRAVIPTAMEIRPAVTDI